MNLKFNKTEITPENIFLKKLQIIIKMLFSDRFIFIEMVDNPEGTSTNVRPVAFNSTVDEMHNITKEVYTRTIDVVYGDVSQATRIIKQFNSSNLTLSN